MDLSQIVNRVVSGTGHRPNKLADSYEHWDDKVEARLTIELIDIFMKYKPSKVISGMALGWDTVLARAALACDIFLELHIPCKGQEKRWPQQAQQAYRDLCEKADEVVILSETYTPWCMQKRNESMVDNSDVVIALWNGTKGGTGNCIEYAKKKGKPIINLWDTLMVNMCDNINTFTTFDKCGSEFKVSIDGRIWRDGTEIIRPNSASSFIIRAKDSTVRIQLHRILAEAFIPNPENKLYVLFKDGDDTNVNIDNLVWSHTSGHYIGKRSGKLTVFEDLPKSRVLCKCDCGSEHIVSIAHFNSGACQSCGCSNKNMEGLTSHPQFNRFSMMHQRCYNPQFPKYKNYGGRGIVICDEWSYSPEGFKNFLRWIENNPHVEGTTLDRINNDGDYEPSNCRWATPMEQTRNSSSVKEIEYFGTKRILKDWAGRFGISPSTLHAKLSKSTPEEVIAELDRNSPSFIDPNVILREEDHTYFLNGEDIGFTSVSTLLHHLFPPFIPEKIAENLLQYPKYYGRTVKDILEEWEETNKVGSLVHWELEQYALSKREPTHYRAQHGREWLDRILNRGLYRVYPEVILYVKDLRLCGTTDLILEEIATGHLHVMDYKCIRKLRFKSFDNEMGIHPITKHLMNCNFVIYSLQLSVYRYILEEYHNRVVHTNNLIHVRENDIKVYRTPYHKGIVKKIFDLLPDNLPKVVEH